MKPNKIVTVGAVVVVGVALALLLMRPRKAPEPEAAPAATAPAEPSVAPAPSPSEAAPAVPAAAAAPATPPPPAAPPAGATTPTKATAASADVPPTEGALMTKLRELSGTNPALSLKLAREGNRRYKDSADAAERGWFVVRSLSDLKRGDEARAEARALVAKYPGSRWAEDVHRHMLVNPPTHPAERGFGKKLEGE